MDLSKVLNQLREELANLEAAIQSLERLQQDAPRRGRPPKAVSEANKAARTAHPAEEKDAGQSRAEEG